MSCISNFEPSQQGSKLFGLHTSLQAMPPRSSKKDPNKPKGRTSAYAFFVQDRREMYKEKSEPVVFTTFSKECADLWREMDDPDKVKYVAQAQKDKERYEREMALYQPADDEEGSRRGKKGRRKKKDPNMPKRSMSGFMFFSRAKRPKLRERNPGASVGELAKQLGAAWKIMTPEQKVPYEEEARDDRLRYEDEMEKYRKGEYNLAEEEEEEDDDED